MPHAFAAIAFTETVKALQGLDGSRRAFARSFERPGATLNDALGAREAAYIAAQRSFYMATVSESGWPYVQHRGGAPGFLKVLDARTLVFADYAGNRQLVTAGNLASDDRVALILVDYTNSDRLKVLGRATVLQAGEAPTLTAAVAQPGYGAQVQRVIRIAVAAFDWNCPQHLPQRFEAEDVRRALADRDARIKQLERRPGGELDGRD